MIGPKEEKEKENPQLRFFSPSDLDWNGDFGGKNGVGRRRKTEEMGIFVRESVETLERARPRARSLYE